MSELYDKEGLQMTLDEWAERFEDFEYREVAQTHIGGVHISTVWMGINYRFAEGGPPLIFETMVFPGEDCLRYATEAEALEGHKVMVAAVTEERRAWLRVLAAGVATFFIGLIAVILAVAGG